MRTNLVSLETENAVGKFGHRPHNLVHLQVNEKEVEVGDRPRGIEQNRPWRLMSEEKEELANCPRRAAEKKRMQLLTRNLERLEKL